MRKINIFKVISSSALLSLVGSAVASADAGYGTTAPNTGITPVSVLPFAALLVVGVVLLIVLRKRYSVSR